MVFAVVELGVRGARRTRGTRCSRGTRRSRGTRETRETRGGQRTGRKNNIKDRNDGRKEAECG